MSVFSSYFIGGFECSTHIARGRRLDMVSATHHDRWALQDYSRLREVGIRTARDGIRWHLIERSDGSFDFSSAVPMLQAARDAGVQVIWDLLHFGWPDHLDIYEPRFVNRFAAFCRSFAQVLKDETDEVPFLCPVNEISFVAFAGGDCGFFPPFTHGRGNELKMQLARAAIEAMESIWDVIPAARFVHPDPMINVLPATQDPGDRAHAEGHRQAQYESWDMISGRRMPELGGRPKYLDILGINYYPYNQWILPGGPENTMGPTHPRYRPLWKMLREVHERYGRPLFISETGVEDESRPDWLRYVAHETRLAMAEGVPVEGICLYPIVNHPGWDDDRHCYNGLWDYADESGYREAYGPLEQELRWQQELMKRPLTSVDLLEPTNTSLHEIDRAAHEIAEAVEGVRAA